MYFLLKMGIFHGYVSLPEGIGCDSSFRLLKDLSQCFLSYNSFHSRPARTTTPVPEEKPSLGWKAREVWNDEVQCSNTTRLSSLLLHGFVEPQVYHMFVCALFVRFLVFYVVPIFGI